MSNKFSQDPILDQVFMVDKETLEKVASFASLKKTETVLEIGTGLGNLTKILAKKSKKVITIELDQRLKSRIKKELKNLKNVKIIFGNALEVIENEDLKFDKVISNPPYAISEPLIKALIRKKFKIAVLTLPWRFVERLSANPEESFYSKLSLFSQAFFKVETVMKVSDEVWSPRPDTSSVIMRLSHKENPDKKELLIRQLALQEDKKLKNALREAIIETDKSTKRKAKNAIDDIGFSKEILDKKISEISLRDIEQILSKV